MREVCRNRAIFEGMLAVCVQPYCSEKGGKGAKLREVGISGRVESAICVRQERVCPGGRIDWNAGRHLYEPLRSNDNSRSTS